MPTQPTTEYRFQAPVEKLSTRHTSYFQLALARWREKNKGFDHIPFSEFPSKYASDVLSAAHTIQRMVEGLQEDQAEMDRRAR